MDSKDKRRLYHLFAGILDYPTGCLAASARECVELLGDSAPEAAEEMQAFVSFAESESPGRTEEIYTRTFDITPTTTLYVGYHLFGETYKRGAFLVRLQEEYRANGFSFGPELADHLCVLLRFASIADDPEFVSPLLEECILPVLEKMEEAFQGSKNGYGLAVSSLRSFLRQECSTGLGVEGGRLNVEVRGTGIEGCGCGVVDSRRQTLGSSNVGGVNCD